MNSISDWALKFVRWGSGLGLAGLLTGYFPAGWGGSLSPR